MNKNGCLDQQREQSATQLNVNWEDAEWFQVWLKLARNGSQDRKDAETKISN